MDAEDVNEVDARRGLQRRFECGHMLPAERSMSGDSPHCRCSCGCTKPSEKVIYCALCRAGKHLKPQGSEEMAKMFDRYLDDLYGKKI